jgi:Ca2+-binding RTX toxin-like protein
MAKHVLSSDRTKKWTIDTSGDTWIVNKGVDINIKNGVGITEDTDFRHDNLIQVLGHISAVSGNGIDLSGKHETVFVGASGQIESGNAFGVAFGSPAYGGELENHGTIHSAFTAVAMFSTSSTSGGKEVAASVDNFGKITGDSYGIDNTWDDVKIVNEQGAVVQGGQRAIWGGTGDLVIINDGTIKGGTQGAIIGDFGDDKIVNTGMINGSVLMNNGNDTFTNKGGSVSGTIALGYGDDVYVIDKAGLKLAEDALPGTDLVKSAISWTLGANFEKLTLTGSSAIDGTGNDAANTIVGNSKANVLAGAGGDDTLKGAAGADHFVFAAGSGHDMITDFIHGTDKIDLSHYSGIASFEDLAIADGEGGLTVTLDDSANDVITLKGLTTDQIAASDFLFAT